MVNEIYEYTIDKKSERTYKLKRSAMVFLYVIFVLAFFLACYISRVIPLFALSPVFTWMLVFFTWRYVSIEYKYTVEAGILKLLVIYGGRQVKEKASFHIKEAEAFLPMNMAGAKINAFGVQKTYNFLSSAKKPKEPYAFMIVKDGVNTLVLIEVPEPSKKAILFYAAENIRKDNK